MYKVEIIGLENNEVYQNLMTQNKFSISQKTIRENLAAISNDYERAVCSTYYLTAARMCELSTVVPPSELSCGMSRNYGIFNTVQGEEFLVTPNEDSTLPKPINLKVLLITMATAKRGSHILRSKPNTLHTEITRERIEKTLEAYRARTLLKKFQDDKLKIDPEKIGRDNQLSINPKLIEILNEAPTFKPIALPMAAYYEPLIKDIVTYIKQTPRFVTVPDSSYPDGRRKMVTLSFDLSRQELRKIIRKNLRDILPPITLSEKGGSKALRNILRHWRISHLVQDYKFTAPMLSVYTGWSVMTAFQQSGQAGGGSNNMEAYVHLAWKSYFPSLLKPVQNFTK